ncbi:MBL fold metallo-hydrolase [Marinitenerispora sediminis]|uniref:MBL fold metallo-hydrolase n=1 Tax=Marinitenerispora sediminis TaxID=1931232 RepID=A0A368T0A5_9ACTN|nr:MBL fold metallo-hydrolase [Marinitenerispora sediminis]RCV48295.1 MBL fold metallo-hydrolase [Marinitenerispora sediminis]RCV49466.1 MBL fold metallo-hydrolase [Marinitenerispora sediminis]RCV52229.1 MBL fold metallo-hydrolase [Marinitenerispora sediminis]
MRITKQGHSCVRLEHGGAVLVIDPGGFSEPDAAVGADAVAITHEHVDHLAPDRLRAAADANPGLRIYAHASVAAQLGELRDRGVAVVPVAHGDALEVAGFEVHVYGERHAVIHPDIPVIPNVGFRVRAGGAAVFHPGDALTVPQDAVDTLFLPVNAPWSKVSEVIDYARAVGAPRAVPVHDGLLNSTGLSVYRRMAALGLPEGGFVPLAPGESLEPAGPGGGAAG